MPIIELRVATNERVSLRDATLLLNSAALLHDGMLLSIRPASAALGDLFTTIGPDPGYPEYARVHEWMEFLEAFGEDFLKNRRVTDDPRVLWRALLVKAGIDTFIPRNRSYDLQVLHLHAGSLDTVIEEVWDDIAAWLRDTFKRATNLLPGGNRTAFYEELRERAEATGATPLAAGVISVAGIGIEASLSSMRATDVSTR